MLTTRGHGEGLISGVILVLAYGHAELRTEFNCCTSRGPLFPI